MSLACLCCSTDLCVYSSTNSHRNMCLDVQSSYLHNHTEWNQCKCPTGEWINKLWNIYSNKKKWTIDSHNDLNKFQRHWGSEMKLSYLHLLQATKKPKVRGEFTECFADLLAICPLESSSWEAVLKGFQECHGLVSRKFTLILNLLPEPPSCIMNHAHGGLSHIGDPSPKPVLKRLSSQTGRWAPLSAPTCSVRAESG